MAKAKKSSKAKKTNISTSPIEKKIVVVNKKSTRIVVKKKAAKTVVKKKVVRTVIKKKAAKTIVKKKAAKPALKKSAIKNKGAVKASSPESKAKLLKATIAALKDELKSLRNDLKSAGLREAAVVNLTSKRDAAVGKFLSVWDKKAKSALDKSLKPKQKKKSKN